jgi:hypothetical protein
VKRMHMALFGTWMVFISAAKAQEELSEPRYWLKQGEGYPVCQDFLANLNAFPPNEPPMVCEQKIHTTHSEFTLPTWESMDVEANLPLIFDAESLLWRFTPVGTSPPDFEAWVQRYRERMISGEIRPRLRRTPLNVRENESDTLISYEPIADECSIDLAKSGVGGDPGGYLFILRKATRKLEPFAGLIGTQTRTDVWLYHAHPYVTTSTPEGEVVGEPQLVDGVVTNPIRSIYSIGLHSIIQSRAPARRYHAMERCYVGTLRVP